MIDQNEETAFPVNEISVNDGVVQHLGMSLRDWFAGMVLTGRVSDDSVNAWTLSDYAHDAYELADAMMEARKEAKQ